MAEFASGSQALKLLTHFSTHVGNRVAHSLLPGLHGWPPRATPFTNGHLWLICRELKSSLSAVPACLKSQQVLGCVWRCACYKNRSRGGLGQASPKGEPRRGTACLRDMFPLTDGETFDFRDSHTRRPEQTPLRTVCRPRRPPAPGSLP